MKRPSPGLTVAASTVAAIMLLPVAYLILRASQVDAEGWRLFLSGSVWRVLGNSVLLAAASTLASVAIGLPLAWLTVRTDLPGKRFWTVALVLPLAMPSYIGALAYIALLGRHGLLAEMLGVESMPEVYGFTGTTLVIALITYPFVMLSVRGVLHRLDPAIEEAAMGLGRSRARVFREVTLPLLRPAVAAGGLLVALYSLSDFGSPALMQYNTFTRAIYTQYRSSFDRSTGALLSLMLVALTIAVLAGEGLTRGRASFHTAGATSQRRQAVARLGAWKAPAVAFCALVLAAALGVPVGVMIYWCARGISRGQGLQLDLMTPIWNSLLAGVLAAAAAVVAALPVVVLAGRYRQRFAQAIDRAAYAGNALPGIVIALALVFFGARHAPWIYQTLPLLVVAYVIRFLPQSAGCIRSSLLQVSPRLEEAARGLGRTRLSTFVSVTLPLILPGALAGAAMVFLTTIKELPVTLILSPAGFETLVSEIWNNAAEGLYSQASPPALILLVVSAFSVAVILRQERLGAHV